MAMTEHFKEIATRDAEIRRLRNALLDIAEGEEAWTRAGLVSIARDALSASSAPPVALVVAGYATEDGRYMPMPIWLAWSEKQDPKMLAEWFPLGRI